MKEGWKNFLRRLKNPPKWALALTYIVCALSIAGAMCSLFIKVDSLLWEIFSYCIYAAAALSLAYTVYTIVLFAPTAKKRVTAWLQKGKFTQELMQNYGFRTVVFAIGSFTMSVLFGMYNGALGILGGSIWFGALAAYYVLLAFLRGGILLHHGKKRRTGLSEKDERLKQIKTYRTSGIFLLILNIALSSAMAQMIFNDEGFSYPGWTIYAFAAYAFYKITMAIYNFVKAQKHDDLSIRAIRNINLMDAAVSILALQTALLHTFTEEGVDVSIYNTATSIAVTVLGISLVVYMLVKASKEKKEFTNEQKI